MKTFNMEEMLDKVLLDTRVYRLPINDIITVLISVEDILKEEENVSKDLPSDAELISDIQSELYSVG